MTLGVSGWFSLMSAVALGCMACNDEPAGRGVTKATASPNDASSRSLTTGDSSSSTEHSDHDCRVHAPALRAAPPGASATALRPEDVPVITKIRVSAHAGGVLLRKQDGAWLSGGKNACTVAPERMTAALTNLSKLTVDSRQPSWPPEVNFELQIDVLMGEEHAVHFEIGRRQGHTDLVKLLSGDVVELRGLDRGLWSSDPTVWCSKPHDPQL